MSEDDLVPEGAPHAVLHCPAIMPLVFEQLGGQQER